jgi:hypothetical protein
MNGVCEAMGGCTTNADCTNPALPVCNPSSHTCVAAPDAGSDAGSPVTDAGPVDSGAVVDASPVEDSATGEDAEIDATTSDAAPAGSDSAYLEGGGCSVGLASGRAPSPMAELLVGLGIALGARRRRRRCTPAR